MQLPAGTVMPGEACGMGWPHGFGADPVAEIRGVSKGWLGGGRGVPGMYRHQHSGLRGR